jgi:hypothetical protein
VAEFTETFAAIPVATIKKRLKNTDIVTPFVPLANGIASSNGCPSAKIEGLEPKEDPDKL